MGKTIIKLIIVKGDLFKKKSNFNQLTLDLYVMFDSLVYGKSDSYLYFFWSFLQRTPNKIYVHTVKA